MADLAAAAEVVLRQDRAFGPDIIDYDLWLTTVTFPVTGMCHQGSRKLEDGAALVGVLKAQETEARGDGVSALRTRILSRIALSEREVMISTIRDRLSATGGIIGSTPVTWHVRLTDAGWKIHKIFFDGGVYSTRWITEPAYPEAT